MAISSVNPFAIGNTERAYGASTFTPVKPAVQQTNVKTESQGFKGFASEDDIEKAAQFLEGKVNLSSKVQATNPNKNIEPKGSLFDGFDISNWNGSPVYQEGEKIYDYIA